MISSKKYTESILPIIKLVRRAQKDKSEPARHLKYLYQQALYGYEVFGKKFASERAQKKYKNLGHKDSITSRLSVHQKKFEPEQRKRGGVFHPDHVYTISMFRKAIDGLPDNDLTVGNIEKIVKQNYAVAWILQEENNELGKRGYKSNRGDTLKDALAVYKKVGIKLLNPRRRRLDRRQQDSARGP